MLHVHKNVNGVLWTKLEQYVQQKLRFYSIIKWIQDMNSTEQCQGYSISFLIKCTMLLAPVMVTLCHIILSD